MNLFRIFLSKLFTSLFVNHKSLIYSSAGLAPLVIIIAIALIAAAVPTTVILVQQEQDNRQEAQSISSSGKNPSGTKPCEAGQGAVAPWEDKDKYCESGICIEGTCQAEKNDVDGSCGEDDDCKSNNCEGKKCSGEESLEPTCESVYGTGSFCDTSCNGTIYDSKYTEGLCSFGNKCCVPKSLQNPNPPDNDRELLNPDLDDKGVPIKRSTTPPPPLANLIEGKLRMEVTVIPNNAEYATVKIGYKGDCGDSPGASLTDWCEMKEYSPNNAHLYVLEIPKRSWLRNISYRYTMAVYDKTKQVSQGTSGVIDLPESSGDIVVKRTFELSDSPANTPTTTPPGGDGGGGGNAPAPIIVAPTKAGWCADRNRDNSIAVNNATCSIMNQTQYNPQFDAFCLDKHNPRNSFYECLPASIPTSPGYCSNSTKTSSPITFGNATCELSATNYVSVFDYWCRQNYGDKDNQSNYFYACPATPPVTTPTATPTSQPPQGPGAPVQQDTAVSCLGENPQALTFTKNGLSESLQDRNCTDSKVSSSSSRCCKSTSQCINKFGDGFTCKVLQNDRGGPFGNCSTLPLCNN